MTDLKSFYEWCDTRIAIAKAATKGKWQYKRDPVSQGWLIWSEEEGAIVCKGRYQSCDGFHIAANDPQSTIALLTALRNIAQELEGLKGRTQSENQWIDKSVRKAIACLEGLP